MPTAETSQEGTAASQPSSSEQLMMGLSDLSLSPGSNPTVPLQEGLFQQQYREEKTLLEQHWERLGFPQKKKALLGHFRRRHRDHMAPYPVERETSISFPGDRAQNRFRCQCRYCQGHMPNISGVARERNGTPSPSSWETLVQGLSGLTLSLGTNRPGILPGGVQQQLPQPQPQPQPQPPQQPQQQQPVQQQEPEEKRQLERQQESKNMFQRLFKQWLEEN